MKFEIKYLIGVIIFVLLFGLVVLGITSSKHYWTDEKAPELVKYEDNVDKTNDQTAKKDLEVAKIINQPVVQNETTNVIDYNLTVLTPPLTMMYDMLQNKTSDPIVYIMIITTIMVMFMFVRRHSRIMVCLILIPVSIYFGTIFVTVFLVFYLTINMFGLFDGGF